VNENAKLAAARTVVELSLRRSPLAPSDEEVESLVRQMIGAALRCLPAEQADNYLWEVEAVATSWQSLQGRRVLAGAELFLYDYFSPRVILDAASFTV
jgi:hypothetical protein